MSSAPFGNEELYQAMVKADLVKLKELVDQGVNFNVSDRVYGTPLMVAISLLKPSVVEFLLEHGADPNYLPSNRSGSPLESAVIIKEVVKFCPDLDDGETPNSVKEFAETGDCFLWWD